MNRHRLEQEDRRGALAAEALLTRRQRRMRSGRVSTARRSSVCLAILAAGAMVLAACGGTSSGQTTATTSGSASATTASSSAAPSASGGSVTVGLPAAPEALDPTTEATFYGRIVFANMCLGLYGINSKLNTTPVLATALPTITNAGKTYTIPLRSGAKFNDGTPLTAAAVVTSLERDKTLATSARASSLTAISSVKALSTTKVQIQLSQPYSPLTTILAGRSGIVMSPTALKKEGSKFSQDPQCVGPFSFVSRPSLNQINLKKSPYFYGASSVHVNKLTFKVITNPSTCYANLLSGAINVAACLSPNDVSTLTKNSSYKTSQVVSNAYSGIDINVGNANGYNQPTAAPSDLLAKHRRLREALALSLSRKTINNVVYSGVNVAGCTPLAPNSPYHSSVACRHRDIAAAKKLVAATGVPTPIHLTLLVPTGTLNVQQGDVEASLAKPAGFDITVQPTEFTTALSDAEHGKYQLFDIGWSGRVDPDQNIAPFWTPHSILNYTGANYPTLTKLLADGRATTSTSARKKIYAKVLTELNKQLAIIYLFHTVDQIAYPKTVTGVQFTADGLIHLAGAAAS